MRRYTLAELVIEQDQVRRAVEGAREWAKRKFNDRIENASLVMYSHATNGTSGRGCGKTHIARACLQSYYYALEGEFVAPVGMFYLANNLIGSLDADTPVWQMLQRAPIVVIDEVGAEQTLKYVGKEHQTQERKSRWTRVVDYAYNNGVSLIMTANLSGDDLTKHIGFSATSRLMEMTTATTRVDMTGAKDWRKGL